MCSWRAHRNVRCRWPMPPSRNCVQCAYQLPSILNTVGIGGARIPGVSADCRLHRGIRLSASIACHVAVPCRLVERVPYHGIVTDICYGSVIPTQSTSAMKRSYGEVGPPLTEPRALCDLQWRYR